MKHRVCSCDMFVVPDGNDSRQTGPFGDFADRPAQRASQCVFHFQSLGRYERLVQTSPSVTAQRKKAGL